jgi:biotin synthase
MLAAKGAEQKHWHDWAFAVRKRFFGNQVFVRAVVEVSNFCRENCLYCGMRRENRSLERYRAAHDQLAELLVSRSLPTITDINIQSGEDPKAVREIVLPLIATLRRETSLGISVCLGNLDAGLYDELQRAGAEIYIMKFEMGNPTRYAQMGAPGNWHERIEHIRLLAAKGWRVSSGFIVGLPGEDINDLLDNFALARSLPLDGCSVSPFVSGDETPLGASPVASIDLTVNCMAALRLMRPHWVIPAVSALNLSEPCGGYRRGLRAGANLVTVNLTPAALRQNYLLYKRDRFIMTEQRILEAITAEGLHPSRESLVEFYARRDDRKKPSADTSCQIRGSL